MRTAFICLICSFMLGYGVYRSPVAAGFIIPSELLLLCALVGWRLGPLVRAAEKVAKLYVDRNSRPGELVAALQEMSKCAFLRRNL